MKTKQKKIHIKLKTTTSTAIEDAQYNVEKLGCDLYFSIVLNTEILNHKFSDADEITIEDLCKENSSLGNLIQADVIIKNHFKIST
jgi:hypothetical protein